MNLGADDYLTKPVANADLVRAIEARLRRSETAGEPRIQTGLFVRQTIARARAYAASRRGFAVGRAGKNKLGHCTILGITESTVKKHVQEMFEKLGVETPGRRDVRALEVLNSPPGISDARSYSP